MFYRSIFSFYICFAVAVIHKRYRRKKWEMLSSANVNRLCNKKVIIMKLIASNTYDSKCLTGILFKKVDEHRQCLVW